MRRSRLSLAFALIFFVVLFAVYFGEIIHRRNFDKAVMAWLRNPTAENEADLQREQHKTEMIRIADAGVAAITVTALLFALDKTSKYVGKHRESRLS